jgi:competence protein CoiA
MIWAINNNKRELATPGKRAICPCCGTQVIAKCGEILSWHWSHKSSDCDPWHEPESDWHLKWKRKFPDEWQEVVIGAHRADVKTPKLVIEFQASCISAQEIRQREAHYRNMVWLLRGHDFEDNLSLRNRDGYLSFRWKWPRKSWWAATSPIVIDLSDKLIHVKKLHSNTPCGGWGNEMSEEEFIKRCGSKLQ